MTQHYVGTKIIEAWPADKDGQPGYGVKYPDGYVSWSPAAAFDAAYLPLGQIGGWPPHVQRLIAETVDLASKIDKLAAFMDSPGSAFLSLPDAPMKLLMEQRDLMGLYLATLQARIVHETALPRAAEAKS